MPTQASEAPQASRRGGNWFLPGLFTAVTLAWLFPAFGARGGPLHPELLTKCGVALIFASQGLLLSLQALKEGTLAWPVHLTVQSTTYLFFPALGLAILKLGAPLLALDLRLGLFYLCALPSTLSSSVALTAAAQGNIPVAALNATLSNVAGIVITPLWLSIGMPTHSSAIDPRQKIVELIVWLGIPFVVGHVLQRWLGDWGTRHKHQLLAMDRGIVLVLVYTSFCDSIQARLWSDSRVSLLLGATVGAILLLAAGMAFAGWLGRALRFPFGDAVALLFCGSHKTLATGVPLAALLFGARPEVATWLLPLMIYHPFQLLVGASLANVLRRRAPSTDG